MASNMARPVKVPLMNGREVDVHRAYDLSQRVIIDVDHEDVAGVFLDVYAWMGPSKQGGCLASQWLDR